MITDLKDLEKLLKLCRKQGVTDIDLGSVKIKLGELPPEKQRLAEADDQYSGFPTGELTPDQLLFYSAGGAPEDDPALRVS